MLPENLQKLSAASPPAEPASKSAAAAPSTSASNPVQDWFGAQFQSLHPLLRALHLQGGTLRGTVHIHMARGMPGLLARWLARQLGLPPEPGAHDFEVTISHQNGCLHWQRCFDQHTPMLSIFKPAGTFPEGYWEEQTAAVQLRLQVVIADGGWHWRCRSLRCRGWPLPLWLFPHSQAYKQIEDGRYRFYVGFSLPLLGTILSYSGLLELAPA